MYIFEVFTLASLYSENGISKLQHSCFPHTTTCRKAMQRPEGKWEVQESGLLEIHHWPLGLSHICGPMCWLLTPNCSVTPGSQHAKAVTWQHPSFSFHASSSSHWHSKYSVLPQAPRHVQAVPQGWPATSSQGSSASTSSPCPLLPPLM